MVCGLAALGIIAAATHYRPDEAAGVAVAVLLVLAAGRARRPTPVVMSPYASGQADLRDRADANPVGRIGAA